MMNFLAYLVITLIFRWAGILIFGVWHLNRSGNLQVCTKSDYTEVKNFIWLLFLNFNQSIHQTLVFEFWHFLGNFESNSVHHASPQINFTKFSGKFTLQNIRKLTVHVKNDDFGLCLNITQLSQPYSLRMSSILREMLVPTISLFHSFNICQIYLKGTASDSEIIENFLDHVITREGPQFKLFA